MSVKRIIYLEILVAIALIIGLVVYLQIYTPDASTSPETATTTISLSHCDNDAKLCPDGSSVLRSGTQCEFAACPSMFGGVRNWQNRKDPKSDILFKYPTELGSQYVTAREWPPAVTNDGKEFTCQTDTLTKEETFNDAVYYPPLGAKPSPSGEPFKMIQYWHETLSSRSAHSL